MAHILEGVIGGTLGAGAGATGGTFVAPGVGTLGGGAAGAAEGATVGAVAGGAIGAVIGNAIEDFFAKTKSPFAPDTCRRNKKECDLLYETDIEFCNSLSSPGDRAACRSQAMERYAACLAGKPIPPLPWRRPN